MLREDSTLHEELVAIFGEELVAHGLDGGQGRLDNAASSRQGSKGGRKTHLGRWN